jgi:DNA-binding response OmpR family regulator
MSIYSWCDPVKRVLAAAFSRGSGFDLHVGAEYVRRPQGAAASTGGMCVSHILVIDDDVDLRDIMQEALRAEGYEVSVAADGAQGIALQRKRPASLLITDIFMPNKEGIETIRDFRAEFPDVPIIAISGGGRLKRRGGTLFAAREVGAATILRKPFQMSDLLRSVAAALNASES